MSKSRLPKFHRAFALTVLAVLALVVGGLVYVLDRTGAPALISPWLTQPIQHGVFGPAGAWLPTAVHTLAFSLFTALALPAGRTWHWAACAFWLAINAAFELGQHPSLAPALAHFIEHQLGAEWGSAELASYFVRGVYDPADIAGAAAGAVTAGLALQWADQHGRPFHAH